MKKISSFSVQFPITVLMLISAVVLLGIISFSRLSVDLFPDLNNPRIYVQLQAGELPPEEMERKFIDNTEALIMRQRKVTAVSSILQVGSAQITVEYGWDTDMDEAFLDLQKNLSQLAQNEEIDDLNLSQYDPNSAPVILMGLSHNEIDDMDALRTIAENYIRNELIRLDGVAAVEVIGGEQKEVTIETQQQMLDAYGLTIDEIAGKIQNANMDLSGGSIEELGIKYVIKGLGSFHTIQEIDDVVLAYKDDPNQPDNQVPVFLKDVAAVEYSNKEPQSIVRLNGKRSVALAVYKETKSNTINAAETILGAMQEIQKALPGYTFSLVSNQAVFISSAIDEVEESALYGIVLAVIILFVFLRRLGTTLIISIAIPVSIIATFNLMYFNDLTLNIMTLGGLALGAGMLVDNAIVVMESIFRNMESGLKLREAVVTGTSQVSGAITASTITTIIVFLPIVYVQGAAGELFRDQAWTVAFSLLASLVVAILVIPMLSNWILKEKKSYQSKSIKFDWYEAMLRGFIERRLAVLGFALFILLITVFAVWRMESEFIPKSSSNTYNLELRLAEGTNLAYSERFAAGLEQVIQNMTTDSLSQVYTRIGQNNISGAGSGNESLQDENNLFFKIKLNKASKKESDAFYSRVSTYLDSFPEIEYVLKPEESSLSITLGTDNASPLIVELEGEDLEILRDLAGQTRDKLQGIAFLQNVESSVRKGRPQINLVIDRVMAGYSGVTISQITSQLQDLLNGKSSGSWEYRGELRDIIVKYPDVTVQQLANTYIYNGDQKIPLTDVTRFETEYADRELYRRNQKRIAWISADFDETKSLTEVVEEVETRLAEIDFPPNYSYVISGEEQKRSESFAGLQFALLLSIILIYMVLASQFESLLHPFTIILTVPLAAVGAILIFFVLGMPLNVMGYIGIIMLMGIAVNDSIILVDAINQQRNDGMEISDAIVNAGMRRIRPIIMTSLTTILALLPLTIGFGESAALRAPMAIAVIGGLISSTVLTLIIIPVVYFYVEKLRNFRS